MSEYGSRAAYATLNLELHTFALPGLGHRHAEDSARKAHHALTLEVAESNGVEADFMLRLACTSCGNPGPASWCNTCEVLGTHPVPNEPSLVTPRCRACDDGDVVCPLCKTRPSEGPQDADMVGGSTLGLSPGPDEVRIMAAGYGGSTSARPAGAGYTWYNAADAAVDPRFEVTAEDLAEAAAAAAKAGAADASTTMYDDPPYAAGFEPAARAP